jgi:hypothetical protein
MTQQEWMKANTERLGIFTYKGIKDKITARAKALNLPLNQYILYCVQREMDRNHWPELVYDDLRNDSKS